MPTALPYIPRFQRPVVGDDGKAFVYDSANKRYVHGSFEAAGAVATHTALTSGVHGISAFGATLIDDASASAARTTLGLGTAATANTGTSAGNVVVLDGSARLPAVDGSQLTNLPGGTPGGNDTYVQFNDGGVFGGDAGFTYAKATDALTVAGRVVTPVIRPAADSTTAVQVQTAGGTTFATFDSTNKILKINPGSGLAIDVRRGDNPAVTVFSADWEGKVLQNLLGVGVAPTTSYQMDVLSGTPARTVARFRGASGQSAPLAIFSIGATQVAVVDPSGSIAAGHANTPTAYVDIAASTTARASQRIRSGTAPTSPNDGDIWYDGTHLYMRIAGANKQLDN